MQRVSKGFYLVSWGGGVGLGVVLLAAGFLLAMDSHMDEAAPFALGLGALTMLYGAIAIFVLWYKMWAAIQDGHARATPGKAVGFLFIPFFNLYWAFQVLWGWAKDYNAYIARHNLANAPKMPEGLFLAYVILCFSGVIPVLGILLVMANFVIGLMMVSKICDGVNALPAAPLAAPSPMPA